MDEMEVGALPINNQERLVGMVTDRDIAIRAVARGLPHETRVSEVMSPEVKYCFDDDELEKIAGNMGNLQVRRLPVIQRNKRLVGIIALADIATKTSSEDAAVALFRLSGPGGATTLNELSNALAATRA